MTGDKITYGESIECTGRWRRMDYETTVKDGETEVEAGNRAQSFVQNFLSKNNPHLYQEQEARYTNAFSQNLDEPLSEPPFLQQIENQPPKKLSQQELILQEIQHCQSENQLKSLQLIANQNDTTKEAYNNKLKELTNK